MANMKLKDITPEFIINWCKENGEVEWLKAEASKTQTFKRYPRVKGEDGKYRADKTQPPVITTERVAFTTVKAAFVKKFGDKFGVEKPKEKEPNFFTVVDEL